jgi:hypothetical protein
MAEGPDRWHRWLSPGVDPMIDFDDRDLVRHARNAFHDDPAVRVNSIPGP